MLSLSVWIGVVYTILLHALLVLPWSLTALSLNSKNQWLLKNKEGREVQVLIEGSTFVSPYLTVINLCEMQNNKRFFLLITPQRVDANAYRKLRVLLRWGNVYKTASEDTLENSIM